MRETTDIPQGFGILSFFLAEFVGVGVASLDTQRVVSIACAIQQPVPVRRPEQNPFEQ